MEINLETLGKSFEELKGIEDKELANQKIDEMMAALSAMKKENKKAIILDRKGLAKKKIVAKKEQVKHIIITLPKVTLENLKGKLGLIPIKIEEGILNVQNKTLETVVTVKFQLQENKKLLAKKIREKKAAVRIKIIETTKVKLDLLKQQLNFEKNTVKFKNAVASTQIRIIEGENKVISAAVSVKDKAVSIKDATVLKGKNIKLKIENTKNKIATVKKQKIDIIRDSINAKKDQIVAKVDGKLYNLKNKTLLEKEKVARKVEHTKNVIVRTNAMKIALLKDSISKKIQTTKTAIRDFVSPSDEALQSNRERIEQLKEQRARLINELMGPSQEETRAFAR